MVYGLESSCNGLVLALADGMFEWSEVFMISFRGTGERKKRMSTRMRGWQCESVAVKTKSGTGDRITVTLLRYGSASVQQETQKQTMESTFPSGSTRMRLTRTKLKP